MTEIPEHLLRRSKAAKSEKAGEPAAADASGASSGEATPATPATQGATPATRPAAPVPAEPTPEPVKPDPAFIVAHRQRRRVPVWALPVVVLLPIWALGFAGTMQQPEVVDVLFQESEELYGTACAACHGAGGGGGVGRQLSAGQVLQTFPDPIDQIAFVAVGSQGVGLGEVYGDPDRPGGPHIAGDFGIMPAFAASLTQVQLEMVVFYERAVLGGEDVSGAEYQEWMEHMRHEAEIGATTPVDLDLILACANEEAIATATGDAEDPDLCPGPHAAEGGEEAAAG